MIKIKKLHSIFGFVPLYFVWLRLRALVPLPPTNYFLKEIILFYLMIKYPMF